ncbi:MAG: hypothetical protein HYR55_15800, partial [Acidobacteria bacterium]|nr:hypothetical protein [Acidobacteriota bacterium]
PYRLPMSIHIVRHSDSSGGLTLRELASALQDLNRLWQPVGLQFVQYGSVDFIDDDYFFNLQNLQEKRDQLRQKNPVADTINVYFTNLGGQLCGETYFSSSVLQGILIDNDCAQSSWDPSTWAHEMGHYFDLYHTHEAAVFGAECPNGSNCATAGDRLCDTPADPGLRWETVTGDCTAHDLPDPPAACGPTPYAPQTNNLMSYARPWCRNIFTPGQVNKALYTLFNPGRPRNLFTHIKYVDAMAAPSGDGTPPRPFRTVVEAVNTARPGDFILVKSGSYPGAQTINKKLTVIQWDSSSRVTLGR